MNQTYIAAISILGWQVVAKINPDSSIELLGYCCPQICCVFTKLENAWLFPSRSAASEKADEVAACLSLPRTKDPRESPNVEVALDRIELAIKTLQDIMDFKPTSYQEEPVRAMEL